MLKNISKFLVYKKILYKLLHITKARVSKRYLMGSEPCEGSKAEANRIVLESRKCVTVKKSSKKLIKRTYAIKNARHPDNEKNGSQETVTKLRVLEKTHNSTKKVDEGNVGTHNSSCDRQRTNRDSHHDSSQACNHCQRKLKKSKRRLLKLEHAIDHNINALKQQQLNILKMVLKSNIDPSTCLESHTSQEDENTKDATYCQEHKCVGTSSRYGDDENLKAKARNIGTQMKAFFDENITDYGALGDYVAKSKALSKVNGANESAKDFIKIPFINGDDEQIVNVCCGCYKPYDQCISSGSCRMCSCKPQGFGNKYQRSALPECSHEEYYYLKTPTPQSNFQKCNCSQGHCYNSCQCKEKTLQKSETFKRRITDLNTQQFYYRKTESRTLSNRSSPDRSKSVTYQMNFRRLENKEKNTKSKEVLGNKGPNRNIETHVNCKKDKEHLKGEESKNESNVNFKKDEEHLKERKSKNENKKVLYKKQEKSTSVAADRFQKNSIETLRQELLKKLDVGIEEINKQLNLHKNKEAEGTFKVTSKERINDISSRKPKSTTNSNLGDDYSVVDSSFAYTYKPDSIYCTIDPSQASQYSRETLSMLKKMKIKDYKAIKSTTNGKVNERYTRKREETKEKSNTPMLSDKAKRYHEYIKKYGNHYNHPPKFDETVQTEYETHQEHYIKDGGNDSYEDQLCAYGPASFGWDDYNKENHHDYEKKEYPKSKKENQIEKIKSKRDHERDHFEKTDRLEGYIGNNEGISYNSSTEKGSRGNISIIKPKPHLDDKNKLEIYSTGSRKGNVVESVKYQTKNRDNVHNDNQVNGNSKNYQHLHNLNHSQIHQHVHKRNRQNLHDFNHSHIDQDVYKGNSQQLHNLNHSQPDQDVYNGNHEHLHNLNHSQIDQDVYKRNHEHLHDLNHSQIDQDMYKGNHKKLHDLNHSKIDQDVYRGNREHLHDLNHSQIDQDVYEKPKSCKVYKGNHEHLHDLTHSQIDQDVYKRNHEHLHDLNHSQIDQDMYKGNHEKLHDLNHSKIDQDVYRGNREHLHDLNHSQIDQDVYKGNSQQLHNLNHSQPDQDVYNGNHEHLHNFNHSQIDQNVYRGNREHLHDSNHSQIDQDVYEKPKSCKVYKGNHEHLHDLNHSQIDQDVYRGNREHLHDLNHSQIDQAVYRGNREHLHDLKHSQIYQDVYKGNHEKLHDLNHSQIDQNVYRGNREHLHDSNHSQIDQDVYKGNHENLHELNRSLIDQDVYKGNRKHLHDVYRSLKDQNLLEIPKSCKVYRGNHEHRHDLNHSQIDQHVYEIPKSFKANKGNHERLHDLNYSQIDQDVYEITKSFQDNKGKQAEFFTDNQHHVNKGSYYKNRNSSESGSQRTSRDNRRNDNQMSNFETETSQYYVSNRSSGNSRVLDITEVIKSGTTYVIKPDSRDFENEFKEIKQKLESNDSEVNDPKYLMIKTQNKSEEVRYAAFKGKTLTENKAETISKSQSSFKDHTSEEVRSAANNGKILTGNKAETLSKSQSSFKDHPSEEVRYAAHYGKTLTGNKDETISKSQSSFKDHNHPSEEVRYAAYNGKTLTGNKDETISKSQSSFKDIKTLENYHLKDFIQNETISKTAVRNKCITNNDSKTKLCGKAKWNENPTATVPYIHQAAAKDFVNYHSEFNYIEGSSENHVSHKITKNRMSGKSMKLQNFEGIDVLDNSSTSFQSQFADKAANKSHHQQERVPQSTLDTLRCLRDLLNLYQTGSLEDENLKALAEELLMNLSSNCSNSRIASRASVDRSTLTLPEKRTIEIQCTSPKIFDDIKAEMLKASESSVTKTGGNEKVFENLMELACDTLESECESNKGVVSATTFKKSWSNDEKLKIKQHDLHTNINILNEYQEVIARKDQCEKQNPQNIENQYQDMESKTSHHQEVCNSFEPTQQILTQRTDANSDKNRTSPSNSYYFCNKHKQISDYEQNFTTEALTKSKCNIPSNISQSSFPNPKEDKNISYTNAQPPEQLLCEESLDKEVIKPKDVDITRNIPPISNTEYVYEEEEFPKTTTHVTFKPTHYSELKSETHEYFELQEGINERSITNETLKSYNHISEISKNVNPQTTNKVSNGIQREISHRNSTAKYKVTHCESSEPFKDTLKICHPQQDLIFKETPAYLNDMSDEKNPSNFGNMQSALDRCPLPAELQVDQPLNCEFEINENTSTLKVEPEEHSLYQKSLSKPNFDDEETTVNFSNKMDQSLLCQHEDNKSACNQAQTTAGNHTCFSNLPNKTATQPHYAAEQIRHVNTSKRHFAPAFQNCPCMLSTYLNMLEIYYRRNKRPPILSESLVKC